MKRQLAEREDIRTLVELFYQRISAHPTLGPVFNEVARVNWEYHLNKMTDFWSFVLLYEGSYTGNTTAVHVKLAEKTPMGSSRFEAWLDLWNSTIDEHFTGDTAELAKQKANQLAWIIQAKIPTQTTDSE